MRFPFEDNKLSFASYYKLPAAQTDSGTGVAQKRVAHSSSRRDIEVQAWYQGGISIMDFTDAEHQLKSPISIGAD